MEQKSTSDLLKEARNLMEEYSEENSKLKSKLEETTRRNAEYLTDLRAANTELADLKSQTPEVKVLTIFSALTVEEGIELIRKIRPHLQERLQAEINDQSKKQLEHQEKLNELHKRAEDLGRLTQLF